MHSALIAQKLTECGRVVDKPLDCLVKLIDRFVNLWPTSVGGLRANPLYRCLGGYRRHCAVPPLSWDGCLPPLASYALPFPARLRVYSRLPLLASSCRHLA